VSFQLIYVTEIFNKYFAVVFVFFSVVDKSLFCHEYFINYNFFFSTSQPCFKHILCYLFNTGCLKIIVFRVRGLVGNIVLTK
jgi:hypothetical protein